MKDSDWRNLGMKPTQMKRKECKKYTVSKLYNQFFGGECIFAAWEMYYCPYISSSLKIIICQAITYR